MKDRYGERLITKALRYFRSFNQGKIAKQKDYPQLVQKLLDAGADLTDQEREELHQLMPAVLGQAAQPASENLSLTLTTTSPHIHLLEPLKLNLVLTNKGITRLDWLADFSGTENITVEFRESNTNNWKPVKTPYHPPVNIFYKNGDIIIDLNAQNQKVSSQPLLPQKSFGKKLRFCKVKSGFIFLFSIRKNTNV